MFILSKLGIFFYHGPISLAPGIPLENKYFQEKKMQTKEIKNSMAICNMIDNIYSQFTYWKYLCAIDTCTCV